jgi:hypothetical protein
MKSLVWIFIFLLKFHLACAYEIVCPAKVESPKFSLESFMYHFTSHFNLPVCNNLELACPKLNLENLPEIIFIGERHSIKSSISLRQFILSKAGKGDLEVATELGYDYPAFPWVKSQNIFGVKKLKNKDNIHIIDSPHLVSIGQIYLLYDYFLKNNRIKNSYLAFPSLIKEIPLLQAALEKISKLEKKNELIRYTNKIGQLYLNNNHDYNQIKVDEKINSNIWRFFCLKILDEAIEIANNELKDEIHGLTLPKIKTVTDAEKLALDNYIDLPQNKVLVDFRNEYMASQITQVICDPRFKKKKLYVLIGKRHYQGVKDILNCLFNQHILMREYDSYDENEAMLVQKELNNS